MFPVKQSLEESLRKYYLYGTVGKKLYFHGIPLYWDNELEMSQKVALISTERMGNLWRRGSWNIS